MPLRDCLVVWILAAGLSSADWLVTEPDGLRCKLTEAGEHYMGTLARASDGSICKMWNTVINLIPTGNLENGTITTTEATNSTSQTPVNICADHPELCVPEMTFYKGQTLANVKNYCRSPTRANGTSDMPNGPWCHTLTGPKYCNVSYCQDTIRTTKQCLDTNGFMTYTGTVSQDNCMYWVETAIQQQGHSLTFFPGTGGWLDHYNYCRNPDNDETIWCYDQNIYNAGGDLVKIYCINQTQECSRSCRLTEGSLEYTGTHSKSETGRPCLSAQSQIPSFFETEAERESYFNNRYVNDDYNVELHYCRSYPDQLEFGSNADGPVCFVKDGDTIREEACAIPFCRREVMGEEEVVDGGIFDDFLATSTVPPRLTTTTTTAPPIEISTSVDVKLAWDFMRAREFVEVTIESSVALYVMGAIFGILGFLILLCILLDITTIVKQCKSLKARTTKAFTNIEASMASLRSKISPTDDTKEGLMEKTQHNNFLA